MKRLSIYFLYGITILTIVSTYDYYSNLLDWGAFYDGWYSRRVDALNDEALIGSSFYIARKNYDELSDFLEARRRTSGVDFWALYRNDKILKTSMGPGEFSETSFDLSIANDAIAGPRHSYAYAVETLETGDRLVVGVRYNKDKFLSVSMIDRRTVIIRYCFGLFIICLGVFAFFFRDFMNSVSELAKKGRRSYRGLGAHSKEADMLVRGLNSYDEKNLELKKEKELLTWQVLPSLRTEIMSGRTPPYDFSCTLVRTDINNFSSIYNKFPIEPFASTINDFFTEVSHVVARYNGLVHEFVGDEVIYYFKDEDCGNSVFAAMSAVRDINEIAANYNRATTRDRGYAFTVKSSLAHGQLHFGRFVTGYGVSGPSLIETVRILSQVQEKEENVLVFDERHLSFVGDYVESQFFMQTKLKGFNDEKRLFSYKAHAPASKLLNNSEMIEDLRYYRGDADISEIIQWCRDEDNSKNEPKRIVRLIGLLRQIPVTKSSGYPQQVLFNWLEDLHQQVWSAGPAASDDQLRFYASIIRLAENLVPLSEFTHQFEQQIRKALEVDDRRVVANALDALTLFRSEYDPKFSEQLARHLDNRVAANALVHEGMSGITPKVIRRLVKLMQSDKQSYLASALYAYGEIAAYHRLQDPVYFNTQVGFHRIANDLPKWVVDSNPRVRRQSMLAAKKLGDADVIAAIWETLLASKNEQFLTEARDIFGDPQAYEEKRKFAA